MSGWKRLLLAGLLVIALPFQAWAGAVRVVELDRADASGPFSLSEMPCHGVGASPLDDPHAAEAASAAEAAATDSAVGPNASTNSNTTSTCSACAACCHGAAPPLTLLLWAPEPRAESPTFVGEPRHDSHVVATPKRPPRRAAT